MSKEIHRVAWTVSDPRGEGQKGFWTRIGRTFENSDGSETILFDALPVNGKVILRDRKAAEPKDGDDATA